MFIFDFTSGITDLDSQSIGTAPCGLFRVTFLNDGRGSRETNALSVGSGDILPENDTYGEIRDLIQNMESKIDSAFLDINSKLENIDSRVTLMEKNPPPSSNLSASTSTSGSSFDGKRKRRSPSELQVCIT